MKWLEGVNWIEMLTSAGASQQWIIPAAAILGAVLVLTVPSLKGFRTYLVAALMAALPSLMTWLEGVNWVDLLTSVGVPQQWVVPLAGVLGAVVMAFMRSITTTPPADKG